MKSVLLAWLIACLCLPMPSIARDANASIAIEGATREQRDNIRAHIGEVAINRLANTYQLSRSLEEKALKAMQALGYFSPELSVSVDDKRIQIAVTPGDATTITSLNFLLEENGADQPLAQARSSSDAAPLEITQSLLAEPVKALQALKGQRFASAVYEQRKAALLASARRQGLLDAAYSKHRVVVDKSAASASVELAFNTGQRYRFGKLTYSDVPLNSARLHSLMRWQKGDAFSTSTLNKLQRKLMDTGYFASVVLQQRKSSDKPIVDIHAVLGMNAPNKIRTGIGYGTDTGPRAKLRWDKPYLNRAGHSGSAELAASAVRQSLQTLYKVPSLRRADTHWQTEFNLVEEDIEDTRSSQQQIGLAYVTPLGNGWRSSLYAKYLRERFTQGSERGRSELLLPGANASLTRSRGGLVPSGGFRLAGSIEGAHDAFFSDATLLRVTADARYIKSFGRHRLLGGLQLGSLFLPGSSNLQDVPSSLRFFAGGDQSIRGYDYRSLAPRDQAGELIGGQNLAVAKLEYNYRFAKNWRAALFVDGGSAFNNSSDKAYLGPGFGVHWLSPIGAVRFDIGFAASDDQGVTLHLNVGPEL
ncbi:MAG: autotransporter assembly complex protein TamA [Gammaproteobacteria bacterium]|nr:autotransporter assembly complex protein TamA [Gammaproteobacteria bacterium]MBT8151151.1 autotransporter assembly complex protein TamA [Gammaproteobacteria bacterium]NND39309.1 outer membrane protein assembly factor [Pseudomonadales bacterium]NNM11645.1 outer membrane protein assembly factor [Pseudomonadales bacterium]